MQHKANADCLLQMQLTRGGQFILFQKRNKQQKKNTTQKEYNTPVFFLSAAIAEVARRMQRLIVLNIIRVLWMCLT